MVHIAIIPKSELEDPVVIQKVREILDGDYSSLSFWEERTVKTCAKLISNAKDTEYFSEVVEDCCTVVCSTNDISVQGKVLFIRFLTSTKVRIRYSVHSWWQLMIVQLYNIVTEARNLPSTIKIL